MRIQEGFINEEKMTTSPTKKQYDRQLLIDIGNSHKSVFTVPAEFLGLAKESGSTSPTRQIGASFGPPKGLVAPLSRGNSRSSLGGGLYGTSIQNGNAMGGFGVFGRLQVPPPPPPSSEPKRVIVTPQREKLLPSNPNAWKPGRLKQRSKLEDEEPKSEEEIMTQGIVKDTRGILNKLTPENFDRLMEKFMKLPLENKENRVSAVISVLFEKAIDEPAFSAAYAKMVQTVCSSSAETSSIFRKQILDKCQLEFQRSDSEEMKIKEDTKKMEETTEKDKKEQLKLELEDLKSTMRKRSLGNVRFIGELFKLQMLSAKIMVSCVNLLLSNADDEKLECLCKLLSTVGQKLDEQLKELEVKAKQSGSKGPEEKLMDKKFVELKKLSIDKKISSRIRFAIMDLVELRENLWKPRRQATGPKTIEEVHRDAYLQELEEKRQIQSLPQLSPEHQGARGHSQNNSPMSHVPKKTDWTTVQNKAARFQKKPADKPPTGPTGSPSPQSFAPHSSGPVWGQAT